MRFRTFVSLSLATNVAVASVCKPRPSSSMSIGSSGTVTSSVSAALSTTTAVIDTATTASTELFTSATSTADGETATETTESLTASTELSASTATETTTATFSLTTTETTESHTASTDLSASTATETTTTALSSTFEATATTTSTTDFSETATSTETALTTQTATTDTTETTEATTTTAETTSSAETTTTVATTTTGCHSEPIPTFNVQALGSGFDGQWVTGDKQSYQLMGWVDSSKPRMTFSIDADTGNVREESGLYLCINYGAHNTPNHLVLYDINHVATHPEVFPVTCEQTCDQRLICSAPAKYCYWNEDFSIATCTAPFGTYNEFFAYQEPTGGSSLVMNSLNDPPSDDTEDFEPVELKILATGD